jgi:hypothetical protein
LISPRLVDAGAIFAGWVGLGMALVLAIAFELIIPLQLLVFVFAPLMGAVIGVYANVRAQRWRPRPRVLANAGWAGLVAGIGMALLYVVLRLVFVYGDSGALPTGRVLECRIGPDCTYARYVEAGRAGELAEIGIADAASLEASILTELAVGGAALVVLTLGGALAGGSWRALRPVPIEAQRESGPGSERQTVTG